MEDDGAALEVGFAIDFYDSFNQLRSLDDLIGATAANTVREFQKLEAASRNVLDLGSNIVQIDTFRNAATRAARDAAREYGKVETQGERLSAQLQRDLFLASRRSRL